MFTPDITLNTRMYSLQVQRPYSSVRSVAAETPSEPRTLTISHDTAKSGRVASLVKVTKTFLVPKTVNGITSYVKEDIEVYTVRKFNPNSGIPNLESELALLQDDLVAFLTEPGTVTKLDNKES